MSARAKRGRPFGLRTKIFAFFALFSVITLALLWLFQIVFLPRFYTTVTRNRMADGAETILRAQNSDGMRALAERVSLDHNAGVRIFLVEGNRVRTVASVKDELGPVIHILSQTQLNALYDMAEAEPRGAWVRYRLLEDGFRFAWEEEQGDHRGKLVDERQVFALLGDGADGNRYFILLDVPREPIGGMVAVLSIQLLVLTGVLLIASAGIAFMMARRISEPLTVLNEAARSLPSGRYPQDYRAVGYREVAELSETLAASAAEIGKTDALQRELIANISHDLRTPLTMIVGYAEVMRDIEGENTPENMQVIIDEARRLSDMVGDLVAISRYQSGAEAVEPTEFSLTDEARALLGEYRTLLAPEDFTFLDEIGEGITVTADRKRIVQVMRNLLDNAVNYSETVRKVTLTVAPVEGGVRVAVSDCGTGIPEDELENIWQRYYRAGGNHKRSRSGSGLGLSIVRENLELHHARYGVESTEGVGTTFWFVLPS